MERHILIIEDETDIRDAIAEVLSEEGYQVSTAENGQSGYIAAIEQHPDLILLDLHMPIMNGHEFLEELRLDPWGRTAKVVVLSAMDDVENIGTAFTGNIKDYIIKGHNSLDEIVAKVKTAF